ncbi:MAG: ArsC family reductase [Micropepsaceae bacterium]
MSRGVVVYGIRNCDSIKKARTWLDKHGVKYAFHDYKVEGVEKSILESWAKEVGWEVLLNKAGTTFRALPDSDRQGLNEARAISLMQKQPSMIKRPVLVAKDQVHVGFKPEAYRALFS